MSYKVDLLKGKCLSIYLAWALLRNQRKQWNTSNWWISKLGLELFGYTHIVYLKHSSNTRVGYTTVYDQQWRVQYVTKEGRPIHKGGAWLNESFIESLYTFIQSRVVCNKICFDLKSSESRMNYIRVFFNCAQDLR